MKRMIWIALSLSLAASACNRTRSGAAVPFDERVMARCFVQDWQIPAIIDVAGQPPFSVLVGSRDGWTWAGTSKGGPLEVPLSKQPGGRPVDVLVVSGTASTKDRLTSKDDAALNRQIAARQAQGPTVTLATATGERGVPVVMPNECLKGDDCTTPQCPPRRP